MILFQLLPGNLWTENLVQSVTPQHFIIAKPGAVQQGEEISIDFLYTYEVLWTFHYVYGSAPEMVKMNGITVCSGRLFVSLALMNPFKWVMQG